MQSNIKSLGSVEMLRGPPKTENENELKLKKAINYLDCPVTVISKTKQTCRYNTKKNMMCQRVKVTKI